MAASTTVDSPVELALIARELWQRKRLLALGLMISGVAAILAIYRVEGLLPPRLQPRALVYAGAYTKAFIDSQRSFVGDISGNLGPLVDRAAIDANLMASPGGVDLIGRYAGIPGNEIYAAGPVQPDEQRLVQEPTATKRNIQIIGERAPYRIDFLTDANLPTIGIYAQAPTTKEAVALANASVRALYTVVQSLAQQPSVAPADRLTVRQIGRPWAGVVDGGVRKKLAGLVLVAVLVAWCVLVLVGSRLRARWQAVSPNDARPVVSTRAPEAKPREREPAIR